MTGREEAAKTDRGKLRLSRYTMVFCDTLQGAIVSNWLTGFACIVDRGTAKLFRPGIRAEVLDGRIDDIAKQWLLSHCFVPAHCDETAAFETRLAAALQQPKSVNVTFVPGFNCNMKCVYCFVSGYARRPRVTPAVLRNLQRWLRWIAETRRPRSFMLHLYGGEPLLYAKELGQLLPAFGRIAKAVSAEAELQVSTNGTLLDGSNIRDLCRDFSDTQIQVTLDGPPEVHNLRRVTAGGQDSLGIIVKGIKKASTWAKVRIRINVDAQNHESIPALFDILEDCGLAESCELMLWPTHHPIARSTAHCDQYVLPLAEAGPIMAHLWDEMARRGLRPYGSLPYPAFCMHWHPQAYAISPSGNIYSCVGGINIPDERIGNIKRPAEIDQNIDFGQLYPLPACRKCAYLPICGGGCRVQGIVSRGDHPMCPIRSFNDAAMGAFLRCRYASMRKDHFSFIAAGSKRPSTGPGCHRQQSEQMPG